MDLGWQRWAACYGLDPRLFFAERSDKVTQEEIDAFAARGVKVTLFKRKPTDPRPKDVCAGCTVSGECLAYSIVTNQEHGVWAVGGTRRRFLRRQYLALDFEQFLKVVEAEIELLKSGFQRRDVQPARECDRCARQGLVSGISQGVHPEDLNGEHARCGKPVTYARGCRCWYCKLAHARRSSPAPRLIINDDETEDTQAYG